jgi:hypothetical protein
MQKREKLLVAAIAAMLANGAMAATTVSVGGVYDVGYMFKRTANVDNSDGTSKGGVTTATLGDGAGQGSRILVNASEDLAPGWRAALQLDLRFGVVEEGSTAATTGGLNSNDRKALWLFSPYGNLRWGVQNLSVWQFWDFEEKPYMVNIQDLEVVKYGVSTRRDEGLTSRNTEYDTPILELGPVKSRLKMNYAFGDNRKSGSNDIDNTGSGDQWSLAATGAYNPSWHSGNLINWGFSTSTRAETVEGVAPGSRTGMHWSENYINLHPTDYLKVAFSYNVYKGFGDTAGTTDNGIYKEKNTNLVVSYNYGKLWQIGVGRAHLNDLGTTRNSGKSWMIGGTYFVSPSFMLFFGWEKDDFARNEGGYKKYLGTYSGFSSSWTKQDMVYTRIGVVKTF